MKKITPQTDGPLNSAEAVEPGQPAAAPVPDGIRPGSAAKHRPNAAASPGLPTPEAPPSPPDASGAGAPDCSKVARFLMEAIQRAGWEPALVQAAKSMPDKMAMGELFLSAIDVLWAKGKDSWAWRSKEREVDQAIQRCIQPLATKLAAVPPFALERLAKHGDIQAQLDRQIVDLANQHLTKTERLRLLDLITKLENSYRRGATNFYLTQTRAYQKKRKRKKQ